MNITEAIIAALEGKKIRKKSWSDKNIFIYFNGKFYWSDDTIYLACFTGEWEIYERPVTFEEIEPGERFKYNKKYYIKVKEFKNSLNGNTFNCLNIDDSVYEHFDNKQVLDKVL